MTNNVSELLPKKYQKIISKKLKNFGKYFHFSDFENLKSFQNRKKRKLSKFFKKRNLKNENICVIFVPEVTKHVSSALQLIYRDEFRTMATIFRVFEFQLQLIFMHIDSFFVQNQLLYSIRSSAQRPRCSPETRFFMKNRARAVPARP